MSYAEALKSDAEIEKLKLAEVKAYAKEITSSFRKLHDHLFNKTTGVIPILQSQLAVSQRVNETLLRQLNVVEEQAISNAQYARRDSLELHGVPPSFDDGDGLEGNVVKLLKDIAPEANVEANSIQAVHRLKNKRNVIVKFVNRKTKHAVIVKKAKLKEESVRHRHNITENIWLNESMCFQVRHLYYLCRLLKEGKHIEHYSFFNGSIRVKMEPEGDRTTIRHINDLVKLTGMDRKDIENLCN